MSNQLKKFASDQPISLLGVRQCILFLARANIRPVLKQELKKLGLEAVVAPDTVEDCLNRVKALSMALLVIDTEHDSKDIIKVLTAAQSRYKVDTRPILLITNEIRRDWIAISLEYNVSRVHSGNVSRASIAEHLQFIFDQERGLDIVRSTLLLVADARACGDLKKATSILKNLHERYPDNSNIIVELADNLMQEEEWEEAHSLLKASDPMDKVVNIRKQHLLARCLLKQKRHREAMEILQSINLINPFNVERLVELGHVYLEMEQVRAARQTFEQALDIDAENRGAQIGKGQCVLIEGDVNEALDLLKNISSPRELASIFNNAAIMSIRLSKLDVGINLYKTALKTVDNRAMLIARLLFNMGIAYYKFGQLDNAYEYFEKAALKDRFFEKARFNVVALAPKVGRIPNPTIGQTTTTAKFSQDFDNDLHDEDMPI